MRPQTTVMSPVVVFSSAVVNHRFMGNSSSENAPTNYSYVTSCGIFIRCGEPPVHGQLLKMLGRSRPTAGVTGKGGSWRTKPPDAESASWGRFPASAGKAPHLSGARGVGQFLTLKSTSLRFLYCCKPFNNPRKKAKYEIFLLNLSSYKAGIAVSFLFG